MVVERLPPFLDATQQGVGDALRRAIPLPDHDREEAAERRLLRRQDVKEQLQ